jgi:hypothetical protein
VPVLSDNPEAAVQDLLAGNIDLVLGKSVFLAQSFLTTDRGKDYEFAGPAFTDPDILGVGAGIAVRKDEAALLDAFNKALRQIRADGTFKQRREACAGTISPGLTPSPLVAAKAACTQIQPGSLCIPSPARAGESQISKLLLRGLKNWILKGPPCFEEAFGAVDHHNFPGRSGSARHQCPSYS